MEVKIKITSLIAVMFVLLSIGTVAYRYFEGWSWIDSLYFTTATLTTVGFGDLHPTNSPSKLFTVVFILAGVSFVLFSLTVIAETYFSRTHDQFKNRMSEVKEKIKTRRRPWRIKGY